MSDRPEEGQGLETLTETQREKLDTLRRVLRIQIDGDWNDEMIDTAFGRLERLLLRLETDGPPDDATEEPEKPAPRSSGSRRGRGRRKARSRRT